MKQRKIYFNPKGVEVNKIDNIVTFREMLEDDCFVDREYELESSNYFLVREDYFNKDQQYHNLNGPAIVVYNFNLKKIEQCWCVNGQFHRLNAPAVINQSFNLKQWYINGKKQKNHI